MKKANFGYCALTADFLHIGHIYFLERCKEKCDKLCVGIMTDESVFQYKGRKPLMTYRQRTHLVSHLKFVYTTMMQEKFHFPHRIMRLKEFYGDDFLIFDSESHHRDGADFYFPYTFGLSSSLKKEGL